MRPEIERALAEVLAMRAAGGSVDIDALGDACTRANAAPAEVDALIAELESRGIVVRAPEGGGGEERLRTVLQAARVLRSELGRTPTTLEIAERSGLDAARVGQALALARVISK